MRGNAKSKAVGGDLGNVEFMSMSADYGLEQGGDYGGCERDFGVVDGD